MIPSPTAQPCRTCHAPVFWVVTENGKKMPVDANPVENGNIIFVNRMAHVLKKDEEVPADTKRWQSHYVTCPDAKSHRKKGVKK